VRSWNIFVVFRNILLNWLSQKISEKRWERIRVC
jgi:hypothetical protein